MPRKWLTEVLVMKETPEGNIRHLQRLRAQAEGRRSRAMEKSTRNPSSATSPTSKGRSSRSVSLCP
jgi:hypothetical protein